MLRDVFYYGNKPNVHPREKFATSLEDARSQCTTEHFWIINEYCDYRGFDWDFDFEFLPDEDVWAEEHNNVWPSQHQKDSGTWLCSSSFSDVIIYRNDVEVVKRKNIKNSNWVLLDLVDETKFDFSWHPDPTDPPYIYTWGCKYFPVELQASLEYHAPDATNVKYMSGVVELSPQIDRWTIPDNIDTTDFDFSWRPDPLEPLLIWQFGTQWQRTGGPTYTMPGATETKYIDSTKVKRLVDTTNWNIPSNIDTNSFDFSWHPDDTSPPYIYRFPTQWAMSGGPTYTVPGATEIKYVDGLVAKALPSKLNWSIPDTIDSESFDFSWHPYVEDEPYIYQFGTQWQKTSGPKYITPGTHANSPVKYIDTRIIKATRLPVKELFNILDGNVIDNFDYSWHPDATEEPYTYVFGNNLYPAEIMPTIAYIVIGATQTKYVNDLVATLGSDRTNWKITQPVNEDKFDFSWKPNPKDPAYIYVWGNKYITADLIPTLEYHCEGATERKYMTNDVSVLPEWDKWSIPDNIDRTSFDFSWRPDPREPDFIYQFGTQWQKTGGPTYIVENATDIKYIDTQSARILPSRENWEIPQSIDARLFDFSWHPDSEDESFIYQFGTQWQKTGGPRYLTPGVRENSSIKYIDSVKALRLPAKDNFTVVSKHAVSDFDYSWHPDETDGEFIYVFGNTQYSAEVMPTIEYVAPTITRLPNGRPIAQIKYVNDVVAKLAANKSNWIIPNNVDVSKFDFSWIPHPNDAAYIYQFGTQHQKTGGPKYMVEGATEVKYINTSKAKSLPNKNNWTNPAQADVSNFDYSWHPDATSPPYIYQFGTLLDKEDGPRYLSPNTNGEVIYLERIEKQDEVIVEVFARYTITTTLEELIKQHPNELFWALNPDLDYSDFDFDWRPDIEQSQYLHAFGSQDNINTQTYFVNAAAWLKGYTDVNYVEDKTVNVKINVDMFFVDRSNNESQARFEKLKQKFPNIQKTRYLNSWVDTINRCINRASSNLCWILNSELDYTDFDFNYYPNPWQMKMVHVFGTQWSHWGTTFMVNRETFAQDTKYIKIIEHLSTLNFVKDRRAKATNVLYDIVYIDHGNVDTSTLAGNTVIKYQNSYITTFQKLLDILPVKKEHYVWIASTVCDYKEFDFTYICDPFAKEQLHVFPSDRQKFGDTFLVDVNKLRSLIEDMNVLEDYEKINYNQSQRAKRLPAPIIFTENDTHVSTINSDFNFPYATYITTDNKEIEVVDIEPMSLWTPESKTIQITSVGGTRIVVPKEAKEYVKRELYDYPYITTNSRLAKSSPMDIVFLSNGETGAEENYQHLLKVTEGLPNRVTRVDGVNGRVQAYHAAAQASNTPWMFTVFAKLKVSNKFDWNWQPDRLQIPKHYVFHARNPVNGLSYGHMAMIAYNKKLTLANQGKGLDFTMDDEHEVLDINSGIANFNTDEWSTWRTAFREALKLRAEDSEISRNRLEMWLTVGMGKYNEYSTDGAQHAIEYYDEVDGDFEKLKLSYDWPWLRAYFDKKYIK